VGGALLWVSTISLFPGQGIAMKKYLAAFAAIIVVAASEPSSALAANLVETAAAAGSFKTFVAALKAAGFTDALEHTGPYTVFAPTDDAFAKLPAGTWNALSKDKVKLAQVLAYHIIPGKVTVMEVKPGKVQTTQGGMLTLTSDNGKVTVNEANITQSDVIADNGVIHAIDTVVLP
jgi:uncharacterized surface protein with fasciclin (FAS1) repeats